MSGVGLLFDADEVPVSISAGAGLAELKVLCAAIEDQDAALREGEIFEEHCRVLNNLLRHATAKAESVRNARNRNAENASRIAGNLSVAEVTICHRVVVIGSL